MGVAERYHQTIFAQLRTVKFQLWKEYNVDNKNISSCSSLLIHAVLGYSTNSYDTAMAKHRQPDGRKDETVSTQATTET
eukprot:6002110-Amphidinium_carterae.1